MIQKECFLKNYKHGGVVVSESKRPLRWTKLVVIIREGTSQVLGYEPGDEQSAERDFKNLSERWSDSFL